MKLTDLKVVYICPDHNEQYHERKVHMDALLQRIGFTDIVHYKSETINYPACLVNATIDILQSYMDAPFLLIEDDVEFTEGYEFDLPPEADAIYFGLSKYGGSPIHNWDQGLAIHEPFSDTQTRVMNMLTTHAIFYISQRYKQAVIDKLNQYKNIPYHTDVLMTRVQPHFMVLAQKKPFFYQANKFNGTRDMESPTKITLE
jgi:hypothetical protein